MSGIKLLQSVAKLSVQTKRKQDSQPTEEIERVIAPYIPALDKSQQIQGNEYFSFYLEQRPSVLFSDFSQILEGGSDLKNVLLGTADVIKNSTNTTGASVYMVDESRNEIYLIPRHFPQEGYRISYKIEKDTTVAAYVAYEKEYILLDDIIKDPRFPDGIGNSDLTVKSVLCVPIMGQDSKCFAIFEFFRDVDEISYSKDDLKLVMVMATWIASAVSRQNDRIYLQRQNALTNYLIDLIKCYFSDTMLLEKLITEIMNLLKTTIKAEHAAFVIMQPKENELYANLYEEGIEANKLIKRNIMIKLDAESDILGLVASSGESINIRNAYNDNRIVQDKKLGYISSAIVCVPIKEVKDVVGIIKMINKKHGGCFTKSDEHLLEVFATYCSLFVSYARLNKQYEDANNLNFAHLKMLKHHMKPCIHDLNYVINHKLPGLPDRFNHFDFYINDEYEPYLPQMLMYLFNEITPDLFTSYSQMLNFILYVRKGYRNCPYHNIQHGFTVCHTMYNMLRRNKTLFTDLEIKALLLGALCHDIDYFGRTNAFLILTNHPFAQLYDTAPMEHHHFEVTKFIIQSLSIFSNLTPEDYEKVITEIKNNIIATDISAYFHKRGILYDICANNTFNWSNDYHRYLLKSAMMTLSDLSGACKPFPVAKRLTEALYEEFYAESDERKNMGQASVPIMDRDQIHRRPYDQVKFSTVVVLPCGLILSKILPNCDGLYYGAIKVREAWKEISALEQKTLWRQEDLYGEL